MTVVPCWVVNKTGDRIDCWAAEEINSQRERGVVSIAAGEMVMVDLWKLHAHDRDWHEDVPREMTVQPAGGWRPLEGVVVNLPGSTILPLERHDGPAAGMLQALPRSLVCVVELYERGTRLTLNSMLSVINQTQRALALDLDCPSSPLLHLGILPAQSSRPIAEAQLTGGPSIPSEY